MAERRMFAKSVVNSGRFLRMPATSRLLYYDLGMQADDDGVVEAFAVLRTTGATEEDLQILVTAQFVTVLNEDFVTLINDWKRNNLIKKDRYNPSIYSELLLRMNDGTHVEPNWNPNGTHVEPQDRLGKDRLGKDRLDKDAPDGAELLSPVEYQKILEDYNKVCVALPKCTKISESRHRAIAEILNSYGNDDIHRAFELAQESDFLTGRSGKEWKASFDWIMKDANIAKILDGNYSNKKGCDSDAGNQFSERFAQYTI